MTEVRRHLFGRVALATVVGVVALAGGASPVLAADGCPNAGIRAQQGSEALQGCRAYELVSPVQKAGQQLDPNATVQGSPDGNAVAYSIMGAVAGSGSSLINSYYLSRRGPDGWSVDPLDPAQSNGWLAVGAPTVFLTPGLETAIQVSQAAVTPGAIDRGSNVYRRDNVSRTTSLALAAPGSQLARELAWISGPPLFGASVDASHFVFNSMAQLTPDAVPGKLNVFEIVGSETRLVSRLPDGTVDPGGAELTNADGVRQFKPISADGRRVFFDSPAGFYGALYMRVDGTSTVPISVSRRAGDPPTPQPAQFVGSSDDGTIVYFVSRAALTDDATPGSGYGSLYRLDTNSGTLTDLTVVSDPIDVPAMGTTLGMSHDGSTLYFNTLNALTPDAITGALQIYRSDATGIRLVARLDIDDAGVNNYLASDDLRYFAFVSTSQPTGFDNTDPKCAGPRNGCSEVYVYDAVKDSVRCATCVNADGGNRDSSLGLQPASISQYASRAVLNDGRVFFTSREALVPGDTNGKLDVYQWQDGVNTLISSGKSPQDSAFAEASTDGRDVFFRTYDQLVSGDGDQEADLYDARVNGGIAAQNQPIQTPRVCGEDACQGPLTAAPGPLAAGSVSFVGPAGAGPSPSPVVGKPTVFAVKTVRGTSTQGKVKVSGKGEIRISGSGLRRTSKSVKQAGTYRVTVALSSRARRTLQRKHRVRVRAAVKFTPVNGRTQTVGVGVTFTSKRPSSSRAVRHAAVMSSERRSER
jgi:hypothetical protein